MSEGLVSNPFPVAIREGRLLHLHHADGGVQCHDVPRWIADADPVDLRLLDRCTGPTLDLGCGPGRLAAALLSRGTHALGVDLSPTAVRLARARGAAAICRSVFAPLPGEGHWSCALLIDGNIGIGGDPARLMARVAQLLADGGQAVVEVSPHDVDRRGKARLRDESHLPRGRPFPWAEIGAPALQAMAHDAGWTVLDRWDDEGRVFVVLARGAGRHLRPAVG